MEIFKNNFFKLIAENESLFIRVTHKGYDIKDFNTLSLDFPTIVVNNFLAFRTAVTDASDVNVLIGKVRPRVEVTVSQNEMEARIRLNITAKEFTENRIQIPSEIVQALKEAGVSQGLDNIFKKPITVQKEILIAEGIEPIHGEDCKITYFNVGEKKPLVHDEGNVNHYELNLIDNVKAGDWLGEKIPATEGTPGITVTGKVLKTKIGRDYKMKYDKKSVMEFPENNKIVLRALYDGAVIIQDGKVRVDNHLIIAGDVSYDTGNIVFDGYVTIQGTVNDGFSVIAKNDISINSPMGIGAIEKIESKEGSIYIKGGIFGKKLAIIQAKKNIYTKYTNECTLVAGDDINIGFYSLDSNLSAKNILLDPVHGRIIGGTVNAQIHIVSGTIGSKAEKKTIINVAGFSRSNIKQQFEDLLLKYKELLEEASKAKKQMDAIEAVLVDADPSNTREYVDTMNKYEKIVDALKSLDEERIHLQKVLETKGEGEVEILKAAYPETYLEIKNMSKK